MNNVSINQNTVTEYSIRQIIDNNQPGQLLAGPFTSEQEAESKRDKYPGAGVFQETWLS